MRCAWWRWRPGAPRCWRRANGPGGRSCPSRAGRAGRQAAAGHPRYCRSHGASGGRSAPGRSGPARRHGSRRAAGRVRRSSRRDPSSRAAPAPGSRPGVPRRGLPEAVRRFPSCNPAAASLRPSPAVLGLSADAAGNPVSGCRCQALARGGLRAMRQSRRPGRARRTRRRRWTPRKPCGAAAMVFPILRSACRRACAAVRRQARTGGSWPPRSGRTQVSAQPRSFRP